MKIFLIIIAIIIIVVILAFNVVLRLRQFGKTPDYKSNQRIKSSKQFSGKSFSNIGNIEMKMDRKKFLKMLKTFFKTNSQKRPPEDIKIADRSKIQYGRHADNHTVVTWLGHSALMIDIGGKRILFDPMLSKYASPFKGAVRRFSNSLDFSDADLLKFGDIDAVIISHDHFDHLDYRTILKIKDQVKHFFVPLAVGEHLLRWGTNSEKITELDWWEETEYEGLLFACTPAQHFSGRDPRHRNSSLWSSWVIKGNNKTLFFSGDSGYFEEFKKIGEKYGPFNLAMMECGQYNELWHEIHSMPEESVQASIDLKSELLLPVHNSAFSLSVHSWDDPINRAKAEAAKLGVKIAEVIPGQSFSL